MPDKHIFCFLTVLKTKQFSTNEQAKEFLEYCILKYNDIMSIGQITILYSIKHKNASEYILKCIGKNVELVTTMKVTIKINDGLVVDDGDY